MWDDTRFLGHWILKYANCVTMKNLKEKMMKGKEELKNMKQTSLFGFWKGVLVRIRGKRLYQISLSYEFQAYAYKGSIYITKYKRLGL